MPIGTVDFLIVYSRVVAAIDAAQAGARAEFAQGQAGIDDTAREYTLIRDAILAADARKVKEICEDAANPHRARFLDWSDELAHQAELPDKYGPLGSVVIKRHADASEFEEAVDLLSLDYTEAEALNMIRQWRENAGQVFGSIAHNAAGSLLAGYYVISGKRAHFTGHRLKAEVCAAFTVDRDGTPTCKSPEACENDIFADAVAHLALPGDDNSNGALFRAMKDASPQP